MESSYGVNSASMWRSLRAGSTTVISETAEFTALHLGESDAVRVILRRPVDLLPKSLEATLHRTARCYIEDPFGALSLRTSSTFTWEPLRVMYRRPSEPVGTPSGTAEVRVVSSRSELATAERIIVDGYPLPSRQPFSPGCIFPSALLEQKGFRVWISYLDGEPVCACFTHDDGAHVGVYWMATLPAARSRGAASSLLGTAIGTFSDRTQVLTPTDVGRPLYERFGFEDREKGVLLAKRPGPHPTTPKRFSRGE